MYALGGKCVLFSILVEVYVCCVARVKYAGSGSACNLGLREGIYVLEHVPTGLNKA